MGECCAYEECEFNGQPECRLPDGIECPHGVAHGGRERHMKITQCPQCGGKARSESAGWMCESCQGFIDMQGGFHPHREKLFVPPMTNAGRIRSMDDHTLAEFLCDFRSCDSDGYPCSGCKAERYCYTGHTGMEDWLQMPAEEDT